MSKKFDDMTSRERLALQEAYAIHMAAGGLTDRMSVFGIVSVWAFGAGMLLLAMWLFGWA